MYRSRLLVKSVKYQLHSELTVVVFDMIQLTLSNGSMFCRPVSHLAHVDEIQEGISSILCSENHCDLADQKKKKGKGEKGLKTNILFTFVAAVVCTRTRFRGVIKDENCINVGRKEK